METQFKHEHKETGDVDNSLRGGVPQWVGRLTHKRPPLFP